MSVFFFPWFQARLNGQNYVFALLAGYHDPPAGVSVNLSYLPSHLMWLFQILNAHIHIQPFVMSLQMLFFIDAKFRFYGLLHSHFISAHIFESMMEFVRHFSLEPFNVYFQLWSTKLILIFAFLWQCWSTVYLLGWCFHILLGEIM